MISVFAPAKVNLHLAVGPRRHDGYHDVTTVMHALDFGDHLVLTDSDHLSLACLPDIALRCEDNLAYRAALAMGEAFGRYPTVHIELRKHVPHGAGLGGGSSDAAAVIAGLAYSWFVPQDDPRLFEVAASLGADIPFFLLPSGCALMSGRGDCVERILPALAGVPVAVIRPEQPVPTAAAYAAFDADPTPGAAPQAVLAALVDGDVRSVAAEMRNNLEKAAGQVVPAVAEALAFVRAASGAMGVTVAGSGSAVFALCESDTDAASIALAAAEAGYWSCAARLGASGVSVEDGG